MFRTFHSISYEDSGISYRIAIGGKVEIDPDTSEKTTYVGDCCMMTFFEYGSVYSS